MSYTVGAVAAVLAALALDRWGTGQRLVARRAFWVAMVIVLAFQLLMNGLLTGLPVVRYEPSVHLGLTLANAPVEDLGFGFALVLSVLTVWSRLGTGGNPSDAGRS